MAGGNFKGASRFNEGGYKKYRAPSVFNASKKKERARIKLTWLEVKVALIAVAVLYVFYIIFFSSFFAVKDVIIEGNNLLNSDEVIAKVPKNQNIFLFSTNKIRRDLLSNFTEIKDLEIYRGIPSAIKIVVLERDGSVVWQSGESKYLISTQGEVARQIVGDEGTNLPVIVDKKALPVTPGSQLLSPNFIAFVTNIYSGFFDEVNIRPTMFDIDETTFDINLYTEAGFYVKFNSLRSSKKQLENLKKVLVEKRDQIHEYVDIRIDGWAYFK